MAIKISIENGKICNQTTMIERLERLGEVWIIDEKDGFGLEFVKNVQRRYSSITLNLGAVLRRRMNLRLVYFKQFRR